VTQAIEFAGTTLKGKKKYLHYQTSKLYLQKFISCASIQEGLHIYGFHCRLEYFYSRLTEILHILKMPRPHYSVMRRKSFKFF
jgi:hypothetical protein